MSRLSTDDEQRTTEHEDRARILEAEFAIFQSDDMINSTKNDIDINDINYSLNYFETHLTLIVSFQLKQLNQLT